nr:hypothetical protein [Tanacetum cinerariifolium]
MSRSIENWYVSSSPLLSLRNTILGLILHSRVFRLGRGSSAHRITAFDIFYLYCIYSVRVVCNIPFWISRYLKKVRTMNVLCGGMFVTKIARSFGLLGREMIEPAIRGVGDNGDDKEDEEVGYHARAYRDMSRGAWQERQGH